MERAVLAHAEWCHPQEACGLLAIDGRGALRMAYSLTNSEASGQLFTVDAAEHFGALTHAESQGWEIGGVFHSHPEGPAIPSPTDLAQPHDSDWVHLIMGFSPVRHLRAWRIRDGHMTEMEFVSG